MQGFGFLGSRHLRFLVPCLGFEMVLGLRAIRIEALGFRFSGLGSRGPGLPLHGGCHASRCFESSTGVSVPRTTM